MKNDCSEGWAMNIIIKFFRSFIKKSVNPFCDVAFLLITKKTNKSRLIKYDHLNLGRQYITEIIILNLLHSNRGKRQLKVHGASDKNYAIYTVALQAVLMNL